MAVSLQREKPWMVRGRFGWDGGFGTSAYSEPANDFIGILMTQRMMDSLELPVVFQDFWAVRIGRSRRCSNAANEGYRLN